MRGNHLIKPSHLTIAVLVCVSFMLAGCSLANIGKKQTTHFYTLSVLAQNSMQMPAAHLGVGPVRLPRLLKRPQLVSRKAANEMDIAEFHQWAGSLKEDFSKVLLENLVNLTGSQRLELYPWKRSFKPKRQIRIDVERFDGTLGRQVVLKSRWRLLNHLGVELLAHPSVITVPVQGKEHSAYVEAQSRALALLAAEIVSKL